MAGKKVVAADPGRSLALLWGSHAKPGRSGLTVRAIVDAAIELADANGLEAVSMRMVAERLKVGTMSLYTHVPGKAELTDLMFDHLHSDLYADVDEPSRQPGWRAALEFIAHRNFEIAVRHPWIHEIPTMRTALGPHITLKYEAELRPLDNLGLTDVEMDSVLSLVLTHVLGTARAGAEQLRTQRDSGLTDEEWWRQIAPVLTNVMAGTSFPVAGRVGSSVGEHFQAAVSPTHALTFGLTRILDGISLLISTRDPNRPHSATAE
ncbi:TetR/AcrR family transcriptional regulator [Kribbella sandramycini]|uniref:AcrR family transcriptional regulator n=1 Tax=Kribbella sandramycini TaxID=60450 RepID=A0A7Y4L0L9_9ACTN|nr:TetR/AcrR family transcriptional regulator [Kribbella sandramycini]MBB6565850.1 AcrR family transcriptional regulator [Kribbella sandramycini]NOL42114.1 TetR/AcrR family transcriptional regulator [Kribbella sandramycini]